MPDAGNRMKIAHNSGEYAFVVRRFETFESIIFLLANAALE